jgi:hypothetical protein
MCAAPQGDHPDLNVLGAYWDIVSYRASPFRSVTEGGLADVMTATATATAVKQREHCHTECHACVRTSADTRA